MSINIDPSYLRYIHDGLNSGSIHAENASSLPEGLTALYEAFFLGELNVKESKQILKRFAYFSLIKKEVSFQFVAVALEAPESEIIDFISTYSKWFNSAQAGKFSIYHERLRTYILSSISQHDFDEINNRIMALSQAALANRGNDEWEYYALEYLSNHLFIASMISGNDGSLKKIAYDTAYWNRQIEISKGFEWCKKMLDEMMQWAAKYDEDGVIECALNKVDLHHMEQNDAPRIVELVANNDIETALQRIEAFGGNDKDGLQRKFILYMLCLIELIFLDSKDKSFRKEAIEKMLKHFDENIPVNHSVFNCLELFPINIIYLISIEAERDNIKSICLFKRADLESYLFDLNSFIELYEHSDLTFKFFDSVSNLLCDENSKDNFLSKFSIKLVLNKQFLLSIKIAEKITNQNLKTGTYIFLGDKFHEFADIDLANKTLINAFNNAFRIESLYSRIKQLLKIAECSSDFKVINRVLEYTSQNINKIENNSDLFLFYNMLASLYIKISDKVQANKCLLKAKDIYNKFHNEVNIDLNVIKLVENPKAFIEKISDSSDKSVAYLRLSYLQDKRGLPKESLNSLKKGRSIAIKIKNKHDKSAALSDVLKKYIQFGLISQVEKDIVLLKPYDKNLILQELSKYYCNSNDYNKAFLAANEIKYHSLKIESLFYIGLNTKGYNLDDFNFILTEVISIAKKSDSISESFNSILNQLVNRGLYKLIYLTIAEMNSGFSIKKFDFISILEDIINNIGANYTDESINYLLNYFPETEDLISAHLMIANKFFHTNNYTTADNYISKSEYLIANSDSFDTKIKSTFDLSNFYFNSGNVNKTKLLLNRVLKFIKQSELSEPWYRALDNDFNLKRVALDFIKLGLCESSIKIIDDMFDPINKIEVLLKIIEVIYNKGKIKKAYKQLDEAIKIAYHISELDIKVEALCKISSILLFMGDEIYSNRMIAESIKITNKIKNKNIKAIALITISKTYFNRNNHINGKLFLKKSEQIFLTYDDISDEINEKICFVLIENNYIDLYINKVHQISKTNMRITLWKKMAQVVFDKEGLGNCIIQLQNIPIDEFKVYFSKGILQSINSNNATANLFSQLLPWVSHDIDSVVQLLEMRALHSCFFEKKSNENFNRYKMTLNINWALDLKDHLIIN